MTAWAQHYDPCFLTDGTNVVMFISLPIFTGLESCEYQSEPGCLTPVSCVSLLTSCHMSVIPEGSTEFQNGMIIDYDNKKPDYDNEKTSKD